MGFSFFISILCLYSCSTQSILSICNIGYFLVLSLTKVMLAMHRLDRFVSGLLILARNASKAYMFRQQLLQIEASEVQKQYIARVVGAFPEDERNITIIFES